MNKAFVREPDAQQRPQCPRCGSCGTEVGDTTLAAMLLPAARRRLGDIAWFCSVPVCEVAYFDLFERLVTTDELTRAVFPKDPTAPVCPCFGVTQDEIEADAQAGVTDRVRQLLERGQSSEARCATCSPTGRGCGPDVQRVFMRVWSTRDR